MNHRLTIHEMHRLLTEYQAVLNDEITHFSNATLVRVSSDYTAYSHKALEAYFSVLTRGGKRLRGALAMVGYRLAGGQDETVARRIGLVWELIHTYLLLLDDVADRSDKRRSGPSAHKIIENSHRLQSQRGDSLHFGESIATLVAIAGNHLAMQELAALPVHDKLKLEAAAVINQSVLRTIHGQINDVFSQAAALANESDILRMLRWKTASYTVTGPLQSGAVLAGSGLAGQSALEVFGSALGAAFQIEDDVLGTFGNEAETGKSTRDDMYEGKMTLLVARALSRGNEKQKAAIRTALGNRQATDHQYEAFKTAIEDSGALQYCHQQIATLLTEARQTLYTFPRVWQQRPTFQLLVALTEYVGRRTA